MSKESQQVFFKKLSKIKIGDSISKVKIILGTPTRDQKNYGPKGPGEKYKGRIFEYCIAQWQQNSVSSGYDRYVDLDFDIGNRLVCIESNVDGHIYEIGTQKFCLSKIAPIAYFTQMNSKEKKIFFTSLKK